MTEIESHHKENYDDNPFKNKSPPRDSELFYLIETNFTNSKLGNIFKLCHQFKLSNKFSHATLWIIKNRKFSSNLVKNNINIDFNLLFEQWSEWSQINNFNKKYFESSCLTLIKKLLFNTDKLEYVESYLTVFKLIYKYCPIVFSSYTIWCSNKNKDKTIWDIFYYLADTQYSSNFEEIYNFFEILLSTSNCQLIITSCFQWIHKYKKFTQIYSQNQILDLQIDIWKEFKKFYVGAFHINRLLLVLWQKSYLEIDISHLWKSPNINWELPKVSANKLNDLKEISHIQGEHSDLYKSPFLNNELFFLLHEFLNYTIFSQVTLIQQIEKAISVEQKRIKTLASKIEELNNNHIITNPARDRLRRLELQHARNNLLNLEARQIFIKKYFNVIDKHNFFHNFINSTSEWCLTQIFNKKHVFIPNIIWKHITSFLHDFVGYQLFNYRQSIDNMINLCLEIIGSKGLISNYHIKIDFLEYIFELAHHDNFDRQKNTNKIFHLIPYLINLSVELEKLDVDHFYYQYQVSCIIEKLINQSKHFEKCLFTDICHRQLSYRSFVNNILTKMSDVFDDIFNKYCKYLHIYFISHPNRKIVKNLLLYYHSYLSVIDVIINNHPDILPSIVINNGNYFLKQILTNGFSIHNPIENQQKKTSNINLDFKFSEFQDFFTLIEGWFNIFNKIYQNNRVNTRHLIINDSYFNVDIYKKILKFNNFDHNFNELCDDCLLSVSRVIDYDDLSPPCELCDPLMMTFIKDPIKNPVSNIIMDRNIIERHLLTSQTDPFTRQFLTMDMILIYNNTPSVKKELMIFDKKKVKWMSSIIKKKTTR